MDLPLFDMEDTIGMDRLYSGIFDMENMENIGGMPPEFFDREDLSGVPSEFIDTEDLSGLRMDFLNDLPAWPQTTDNIDQFGHAMDPIATNDMSPIAQGTPQPTEPLNLPGSMKPPT